MHDPWRCHKNMNWNPLEPLQFGDTYLRFLSIYYSVSTYNPPLQDSSSRCCVVVFRIHGKVLTMNFFKFGSLGNHFCSMLPELRVLKALKWSDRVKWIRMFRIKWRLSLNLPLFFLKQSFLGGFKYFLFSPLFGERIPFDEHIFQMGGEKPPTSFWVGLSPFFAQGESSKEPQNGGSKDANVGRSWRCWFGIWKTWSFANKSPGTRFLEMGSGCLMTVVPGRRCEKSLEVSLIFCSWNEKWMPLKSAGFLKVFLKSCNISRWSTPE